MKIRHIIIMLAALTLMASCGSSRKASSVRPSDKNIVVKDRHKPERHNGEPGFDVNRSLAERIVKSARQWLGTPYRYGGQDRKGTDCSGMTMSLFRDVAGVAIPRNSGAQYEYCVSIGHEDLQPGDLVSFSGSKGGAVSHVGLYVGDRRMIHASGSRGVMESSLDEAYWLTHYYGSGRVNAVTYAMTGRKPSRKHSRPAEDVVPELPPAPAPEPLMAEVTESEPLSEPASEPVAVAATATVSASEVAAEVTDAAAETSVDEVPSAEEINDEVRNAFAF